MAARTFRDPDAVREALAAIDAGAPLDVAVTRRAVRHLLSALARRWPGGSVEVRVPGHGAVQCGDGPRHRRGAPPNVVQLDATTWLLVATGRLAWDTAVRAGRVSASGVRADMTAFLPVEHVPSEGRSPGGDGE